MNHVNKKLKLAFLRVHVSKTYAFSRKARFMLKLFCFNYNTF